MNTKRTNPIRAKLPYEELAPNGNWNDLTLLEYSKGVEYPDDNTRLRDRSLRTFNISGLISTSPYVFSQSEDVSLSVDENQGSSWISIPSNSVRHQIQIDKDSFFLNCNKNGELAKIDANIDCDSIEKARTVFINKALLAIDQLAIISNTPVFLEKVKCYDPKNQVCLWSFPTPYRHVTLPKLCITVLDELREVFALFREALNSCSIYYKFFCFYKVANELLNKKIPLLRKEAKKESIPISQKKLIVEDTSISRRNFKLFIGLKYKEIIDEFRKSHRNVFAHFRTFEGHKLDLHSVWVRTDFNQAVILLEFICRELIVVFESLHRQLKEKRN